MKTDFYEFRFEKLGKTDFYEFHFSKLDNADIVDNSVCEWVEDVYHR